MKRILIAFALTLLTVPALAASFPTTTNNDDSCDIATLPAATLLLPYFEVDVDIDGVNGPTTLFTVTNVTNVDRIARVTLWSDYGYPVIGFNIYLTGYDVQSINLFDIIARGIIAPDRGTGTDISDRGDFSDPNTSIDLAKCNRLPGALDNVYVTRMHEAFTKGRVPAVGTVLPKCDTVGNVHQHATGYATIDVVGNCGFALPNEAVYWSQDIRYDNALTGDYQQVDSSQNSAQANPMVHIRAMPEGGTPSSRRTGAENHVNFEHTFYENYSPATFNDGRQPLPSTFAARWIQGGPLDFRTLFKIWRQVATDDNSTCNEYAGNKLLPVTEVVVFDENENSVASRPDDAHPAGLPGTSTLEADDEMLPQLTTGSVSGWTYFNLNTEGDDDQATQNWVIVSMRSQGRYSVDFDAVALGNGCSTERAAGTTIGPAPNAN